MANINEVFGGSFLKADDLKGASPRVTISSVEVKDFDDGKKIIVHFQGKEKCLVVNKTNASILAENIGSTDTDDWVGHTVQLCVKKVEFQGKLVPAIRVVLNDAAPVAPSPRKPAPARGTERELEPSDNDGLNVDDVPFA